MRVCDAKSLLKVENGLRCMPFERENRMSTNQESLLMPLTTPLKFATCDLCDAHKNDATGDFRVLPPVFQNFGMLTRFSGPVVTIKCFEDNSLITEAVDSAGEGRVLVVCGGASLRRALLGGNLGAAATQNGWAGVVIDGCVRDVAELAQCRIGIRALAAMPLPTDRRGQGQRVHLLEPLVRAHERPRKHGALGGRRRVRSGRVHEPALAPEHEPQPGLQW